MTETEGMLNTRTGECDFIGSVTITGNALSVMVY